MLRAIDRFGDIVDAFLGIRGDFPGHGEIIVGFDRTILGGQVAHMTITGKHLEP